jgi:hypothetical protein
MFDKLIVTLIVLNTKKIISISIFFVFLTIMFCSQPTDFFSVSQITGVYTSFNNARVGFHHARVGARVGYHHARVGLNLARVGSDHSRVGFDHARVGFEMPYIGFDA